MAKACGRFCLGVPLAALRARFGHEVLALEREPHLFRPKPRQLETRREALAREVRAMLVVDVPERRLAEDPFGVGKLEQDRSVVVRLRPGTDDTEERADVRHVLERVAAHQSAPGEVDVLWPERLREERDVAVRPGRAGWGRSRFRVRR